VFNIIVTAHELHHEPKRTRQLLVDNRVTLLQRLER
jgi:hypothetical protein